jgi:hypothetical protein
MHTPDCCIAIVVQHKLYMVIKQLNFVSLLRDMY